MGRVAGWVVVGGALVAVGAGVGTGVAGAQNRRPAELVSQPSAGRVPDAEEAGRIARQSMADALVSRALDSIRKSGVPESDTFRLAALMFAMAGGLTPGDAEVLRLEIEAWDQAGEEGRALGATRRLVQMDPLDTPALLRVINARMSELQTGESRLRAYDRLLKGEGAESLDASVRSRLALDAALLARDMGDEAGFVDRVTLATVLDSTNEEAALLAAAYYLDGNDDPRERFDALVNVVLADPLDADALHRVARELMKVGAFRGALRWMNLSVAANVAGDTAWSVVPTSSPTIDEERQFDRLLSLWNAEGPLACLDAIHLDDARVAARYERRRAEAAARGADPDAVPPALLPYRTEYMRAMIVAALRERTACEGALERLTNWTQAVVGEMTRMIAEDPEAAAAEGITEDTTAAFARRQMATEVWMRLLMGVDVPAAAELVELLKKAPEGDVLDARALQRFEGWLAVHRDQAAEARELLAPLAEDDPAARIALAMLAERQMRSDDAVAEYVRVIEMDPTTSNAAYARTRVSQLRGDVLGETELVAELNARAERELPWLEQMVTDPRTFVSLRAGHVEPRIGPLGRVELDIALRNVGRAPLSLGEDGAINSRMLLSPGVQASGRQQSIAYEPEVVRLNRRFRLMPNEEVRVRVWAGRGSLSRALDEALGLQTMLRWRVVQGFVFVASGGGEFATGPSCVAVQTDMLVREAADVQMGASSHADRVLLSGGVELLRLVKSAAFRLWYLRERTPEAEQEAAQQDVSVLRAALGERLGAMSADEVGFTVFTLSKYDELNGALLDAADSASEGGPAVVRVMVLLARLKEGGGPDHALFAELEGGGDAVVAEFARTLREGMIAAQAAGGDPAVEGDGVK